MQKLFDLLPRRAELVPGGDQVLAEDGVPVPTATVGESNDIEGRDGLAHTRGERGISRESQIAALAKRRSEARMVA